MSANSGLSRVPKKRRPYNGPILTKLTPEEAKTALETKGLPDDENVQKLMEAVKRKLGEKKMTNGEALSFSSYLRRRCLAFLGCAPEPR